MATAIGCPKFRQQRLPRRTIRASAIKCHYRPSWTPEFSTRRISSASDPASRGQSPVCANPERSISSRRTAPWRPPLGPTRVYCRAASGISLKVDPLQLDKGKLLVSIDEQQVPFDALFLRDSCACSECVDLFTQQKLFRTCDIDGRISVREAYVTPDSKLRVYWSPDLRGYSESHYSEFDEGFLRQYGTTAYEQRSSSGNYEPQVLWNREVITRDIGFLAYGDYMAREETLLDALTQLHRYGLVFLRGVPLDDEAAVEKIGTRIGPLMDTFYGRTWNVQSVPDAKNIAYTHGPLGLHMDLLYFSMPPAIQLLHCLRNTAPGGTSIFADSFRAVAHIRVACAPHMFHSLARYPVTYHYRNDGQHFHCVRPTVELDHYSDVGPSPQDFFFLNKSSPWSNQAVHRIANVNWSPPFQGLFEVDTGSRDDGVELHRYHVASRQLAKLLDDPSAVFEHRLTPGQCVLFNNRRVVHGRHAFDPTVGKRWFRGAYLDGDSYRSRLRTLSALHKEHVMSDMRVQPDADSRWNEYI